MMNRRTAAMAVILGLVIAASSYAFNAQRRNHLTFSRPVALPGIELTAGSYTFEVLEPGVGINTVRVRDRDHILFTGLTQTVTRPAGMDPTRLIVLGESARGTAPPIEMWFPIGDQTGHRFIYTR